MQSLSQYYGIAVVGNRQGKDDLLDSKKAVGKVTTSQGKEPEAKRLL